MELQEPQVNLIRKSFRKMQSKEDFLALLNYAKKILYGEQYRPFLLKHLNYHSNPASNTRRYVQFTIKKKAGGERIIHSPNKGLKAIQKCLNLIFQAMYDVHGNAKGFVPGRSVVDNALVHAGSVHVYNIDLKDFFPSIDQARVWSRLKLKPFGLNGSAGKHELANIIAALCCQEMLVDRLGADGEWRQERRNVLPQGAPTSPVLTNIICEQLDYYLSKVALRFNLKYSRYADDITFSSANFVYGKNGAFIQELEKQIAKHGFHIKTSKTRLQKRGFRQEVTGLVVNEKPNVQRRYVKALRMWLFYWERYGYLKADRIFAPAYIADKGHVKGDKPNMSSVIRGKLDFLKMVKGADDGTYKTLNVRFERLISVTAPLELEPPVAITPVAVAVIPVITGLPIVHRPLEVVNILKLFSVNESALKYATHTWDAGQDDEVFKDYPDFIKKARKEFNAVGNQLQVLKPQLRAKILSFLLNKNIGSKKWGLYGVKFGWSSPELRDAMLQNPGMAPESMTLPEYAQLQITSKRTGTQIIQKFRQVIDLFKNEIEIRDESPALEDMILEFHFKYIPHFTLLELANLRGKHFYTDVAYMHKAFKEVFLNIAKRPGDKIVGYRLTENASTYQLAITNYGSTLRSMSMGHEKFSLSKGDFGTIKSRLINLCDWSIETEFTEGSYRLNFLATEPDTPAFEQIEAAKGFTYLFTFYK
jgi:hypothetical protein